MIYSLIGHVHKYQTPNWTLRKFKKVNFAHNLPINLLQSLKFYGRVDNVVPQRIFRSNPPKWVPGQTYDKKITLLLFYHFMENLKMYAYLNPSQNILQWLLHRKNSSGHKFIRAFEQCRDNFLTTQ